MPTKTRRGNGEGSVYWNAERDRWVAEILTPDGKRPRRFARTKAEAIDRLQELQDQIAKGVSPQRSLSVAAFTTSWLESVRGTVKDSTFDHYNSLIKTHVLPRIGKQPIQSIQPTHLAQLYKTCREAGSSASTVRHVHKVLRMTLQRAFEWGYLSRNPTEFVKPPRKTQRDIVVLTAGEVRVFLNGVNGHRLNTLWSLACTTGARVSELLALRWSDVDFADGEIHIGQSLVRKKGFYQLEEPKTRSSVRSVPLTQFSLAALTQHQEAQSQDRLSVGMSWNTKWNLVFTNEVGEPLDRGHIYRQFKRLAKEVGLPSAMTFHDLRHTAASLLLANGMPVPLVSEMLGHSSPAVTFQVYSHAIPHTRHQLAEMMESLLATQTEPARIDSISKSLPLG